MCDVHSIYLLWRQANNLQHWHVVASSSLRQCHCQYQWGMNFPRPYRPPPPAHLCVDAPNRLTVVNPTATCMYTPSRKHYLNSWRRVCVPRFFRCLRRGLSGAHCRRLCAKSVLIMRLFDREPTRSPHTAPPHPISKPIRNTTMVSVGLCRCARSPAWIPQSAWIPLLPRKSFNTLNWRVWCVGDDWQDGGRRVRVRGSIIIFFNIIHVYIQHTHNTHTQHTHKHTRTNSTQPTNSPVDVGAPSLPSSLSMLRRPASVRWAAPTTPLYSIHKSTAPNNKSETSQGSNSFISPRVGGKLLKGILIFIKQSNSWIYNFLLIE